MNNAAALREHAPAAARTADGGPQATAKEAWGSCLPGGTVRSTSQASVRNGPERWRTGTASIAVTSPSEYAATTSRTGSESARSTQVGRSDRWTTGSSSLTSSVQPLASTTSSPSGPLVTTTLNGPGGVATVAYRAAAGVMTSSVRRGDRG